MDDLGDIMETARAAGVDTQVAVARLVAGVATALVLQAGGTAEAYRETDRDGYEYDGVSFESGGFEGEVRIYTEECIGIGAVSVGGERSFAKEFSTISGACLALRFIADGLPDSAARVPADWQPPNGQFPPVEFFGIVSKAVRFFEVLASAPSEVRRGVVAGLGTEGVQAMKSVGSMLKGVGIFGDSDEELSVEALKPC